MLVTLKVKGFFLTIDKGALIKKKSCFAASMMVGLDLYHINSRARVFLSTFYLERYIIIDTGKAQ